MEEDLMLNSGLFTDSPGPDSHFRLVPQQNTDKMETTSKNQTPNLLSMKEISPIVSVASPEEHNGKDRDRTPERKHVPSSLSINVSSALVGNFEGTPATMEEELVLNIGSSPKSLVADSGWMALCLDQLG
uniref:Uncharacterized protein n=1 Tax=Mola mola TaxID=94237 RepID=A0A3Q3X9T8_MOLML